MCQKVFHFETEHEGNIYICRTMGHHANVQRRLFQKAILIDLSQKTLLILNVASII